MSSEQRTKRIQALVIGGGQAGLAVGYNLAKLGIPFQILDANQRVGDAWRNRWDSLRLFTPARYTGLPGFPFPAARDSFPTKDAMADYLECYVQHFQLPVQHGVKVDGLSRDGDRFIVTAGTRRFEADNVVVAMANYQSPRLPAFAHELDPSITQIHSHHYRNPSQLQEGSVLIVGAGNSGADIAIEVAQTHPTWMAGKESGHIPWPIEGYIARNYLVRGMRFIFHYVLSVGSPIGRKLRPKMLNEAAPLVRVKPKDLLNIGVVRVSRIVGVRDGKPLTADHSTLDVRNVIWCTGYHPGFSWIDLPIFDERGNPKHDRGLVPQVPGLYFVGLHFLYSLSSATLMGIARDAERISEVVHQRLHSSQRSAPLLHSVETA